MTNAEAFRYDFGIYATELWSMTEEQFLEWLNAECDRERPRDMVVRCKDCKYYAAYQGKGMFCTKTVGAEHPREPEEYCSDGERRL